MFGKINMVDMYALSHEFTGGRGIELFQHLEFTAPLSGIVPPMIFGGIASVQTDPAKFTLMIYDPTDQTQQTGFEDPFGDGVTLSGSVRVGSRFFGKAEFIAVASRKRTRLLQFRHHTLVSCDSRSPGHPAVTHQPEHRRHRRNTGTAGF